MSRFAAVPIEIVQRLSELGRNEILVLVYLYGCRNRRTGKCNPRQLEVAEGLGIPRPRVNEAFTSLAAGGWMKRAKDGNIELSVPITSGRPSLPFAPKKKVKKVTLSVTSEQPEKLRSAELLPLAENYAESNGNYAERNSGYAQRNFEPDAHIRNARASLTEKEHRKNKDKTRASRGVSPPTAHSILMRHHHDRIGVITDGSAQGKAIKSILAKFTAEDALHCYDYQVQELKPDGWRSSVTWQTVYKFLPEWVTAGRPKSPHRNNGTHRLDAREKSAQRGHATRTGFQQLIDDADARRRSTGLLGQGGAADNENGQLG